MKKKIETSIRLLCCIMFLTLCSCENEQIQDINNDHAHGISPNEVSLDFFKETTKIDNVDLFLKQKITKNNAQKRVTNFTLTDFVIDTSLINQCILSSGNSSFSFRIYPRQKTELSNEVHNLVITKINNQWETSIFLLRKNSKITEGKLFSSIEEIYKSVGLPTEKKARFKSDFAETTRFHCTRTGDCSGGVCDMCSLCVTRTIGFISVFVGAEDYQVEDNIWHYQNPNNSFIFNGGGGGSIGSDSTVNFYNNLSFQQQQWADANQDIYNQIKQYLNQNSWSEESVLFANEIIDSSRLLEINAMEVWNDYDNFVNQMSISEKSIFNKLPANRKLWYMVSAKKARDKAEELFPLSSLHNGKGDAFRHALWNGLCALTLAGNLGEQLTTAHENKPAPPNDPFNYKETEMDLYNNEKGRQVAILSNLTNITDHVLQDLNNGYLRYLNNLNPVNGQATYNSLLIPTNQ